MSDINGSIFAYEDPTRIVSKYPVSQIQNDIRADLDAAHLLGPPRARSYWMQINNIWQRVYVVLRVAEFKFITDEECPLTVLQTCIYPTEETETLNVRHQ